MTDNLSSCGECPDGRVRDASGRCVMPAITFASFVLSLNTSALYHMGELSHPETGQRLVDRELAKHTIDTLMMLADKTKGNLEPDENELLTRVLYELKMRFVKLS
jgi:CBS domain containing-hemolysin-like protein